jgi:hypothetical protein
VSIERYQITSVLSTNVPYVPDGGAILAVVQKWNPEEIHAIPSLISTKDFPVGKNLLNVRRC